MVYSAQVQVLAVSSSEQSMERESRAARKDVLDMIVLRNSVQKASVVWASEAPSGDGFIRCEASPILGL